MGFGLLLVGYVLAFAASLGLGPYLFAGKLIGGFLMYLGISELKKYSPVFLYAFIANVILILCSIYDAVAWVDGQFLLELPLGNISPVMDYVTVFLELAFNLTMLYGIADLSVRVDFPETKSKAFRNMGIVAVFYVIQILMILPIGIFDSDKAFFMTLLMILQVIYALINSALIFKCYAMICPEGQEDMPRKPSRFEFVNRIRAQRDAKEEKAINEMTEYYENKLKAKNEKRRTKKKK